MQRLYGVGSFGRVTARVARARTIVNRLADSRVVWFALLEWEGTVPVPGLK